MLSIGQIISRSVGALLCRRWTVLGLMVAWLVLDGPLLGYLNALHPPYGLMLPPGVLDVIHLDWFLSGWFQIFLLLPEQLVRDVVRAVFVGVLLRALLAPVPGAGARGKAGFVVPVLLVLVVEIAWTMILFPLDYGLSLTIVQL